MICLDYENIFLNYRRNFQIGIEIDLVLYYNMITNMETRGIHMKVLFFNVGESEETLSPIAKYAMYEIDRDIVKKIIDAREMGVDLSGSFEDTDVVFKDGEVFYKGQFMCYEKDLFTKHLTQKGRENVIGNAVDVCETLKGQDVDTIYVYLPPEMNYEEVASIVYNICWENGQMLNEDNIIHDERLFGIDDMKKRDTEGKGEESLRKDHEKAVLSFVKELTSKLGRSAIDTVIICGGNDLYKTLTTSKKTKKYCEAPQSVVYGAESSDTPDKYCVVDAIEAGKDLAPGEVVPMYIEQPKSAIERIFG